MATNEIVENALKEKIMAAIASGKNSIGLKMKVNGDEVVITLCSQKRTISSINDIEYYLVDCRFPWMGNSDLSVIAKNLNNWQSLIKEEEDEKRKLKEYYDNNFGTGEFDSSWFSDWHKDVYGYRPHGNSFGWSR